MAESSLSPKSASPREVRRSYSAADRMGTGTASSTAALIVQRPSPESDTRPWKLLSCGPLMSAEADRSRRQDASASPHLGDVGQIEVVLIVLGLSQRRRLGIDLVTPLADVGGAQDAEPFRVGGHDPVLDPVVDHLDEVSGAIRPAVEIPAL